MEVAGEWWHRRWSTWLLLATTVVLVATSLLVAWDAGPDMGVNLPMGTRPAERPVLAALAVLSASLPVAVMRRAPIVALVGALVGVVLLKVQALESVKVYPGIGHAMNYTLKWKGDFGNPDPMVVQDITDWFAERTR
ncbi:MAG: hypothetical protein ACRCYR_16025 [Phycicoccus sp.]